MIQARIHEEESRQILVNRKDKFGTKFRSRGHTTVFTLQKRHTIDQTSHLSPKNKPQTMSPETKFREQSELSPQNLSNTCSNFMKNYVQKLKKQRKREKKRLNEISQNKYFQKESGLGWDIAPLPLIHHGKQEILIFQKISPGSFKSAVIQPVPSSSTLDNQKIEDIMHQIRLQKQKIAREAMKKRMNGLPSIEKQMSEKKRKMVSIQNLDPWQAEHGHPDTLFDEIS